MLRNENTGLLYKSGEIHQGSHSIIDKLRTTNPAAKQLGLPGRTLAELRKTGAGPAYYLIRGRPYYSPSDLDAWLESCRCTPEQESERTDAA